MGDENVVLYDETSPLEQTRRSVLYYQPRPEEAPTYLVELPEKRTDAPRPSSQPTTRPRRSTIVNTLQLPETREAEEQPLEEYVRRNISGFRKSLTPEDLERLETSRAQERYQEGEVVSPATAEEIERDLMDSKKRKNRGSEGADGYEKSDSLPKEKPQKRRVTYESEDYPEPKTNKHNNSNKFEEPQSSKAEKTKKKYNANQNEYTQPRSEVIVMPAELDPVTISHKSPFYNDQKPPSASSKNRSSKPIKVKVSVESSDEEPREVKQRRKKHHSKRGRSDPSSAKRQNTKESNEDTSDVDYDWTKEKHKKRKQRRDTQYSTKGNTIRSRSSSVCLSGESGDNSSETYMVNTSSRKEKRPESHRSDRNRTVSAKDRTIGEKSSSRDKKSSPQGVTRRDRKVDDFVDYTKTTNPFGREEPYSVHYVATKGAAANKTEKNSKKKKDNKEKRKGEDSKKMIPAGAPQSATKVVAKRRYHIQITEHGRPETWFNVRFNMKENNDVDMKYDGPVKINNYYASNNYT